MFLFVVFFPSSEELDMPQQAYFSFSLKSKEIFLYEEVEKKKKQPKKPTTGESHLNLGLCDCGTLQCKHF